MIDRNSGGPAFEFSAHGIPSKPYSSEQAAYQAVYEAAVQEVWPYIQAAKKELDTRVEAENQARMAAAEKRFFD